MRRFILANAHAITIALLCCAVIVGIVSAQQRQASERATAAKLADSGGVVASSKPPGASTLEQSTTGVTHDWLRVETASNSVLTISEAGTTTFYDANHAETLRLDADGRIYVHGQLAATDRAVVDAWRVWLRRVVLDQSKAR